MITNLSFFSLLHSDKPYIFIAFAALLILSLPGCSILSANLHDEESAKQFKSIDIHSAYPTISRENIEQINLIELIDPGHDAKKKYPLLWDEAENRDGMKPTQKYGPRYDLVLSWFRQNGMASEDKRLIRNGVQERMLSASMSRCNVFKTFLRRNKSDVNFYLGSATTVAGVLGAVLPGVTASHNLAGAAGIFSGIQAEYNQSYFSNLTAEVLVKGIELQQATVQERLRTVGQKQTVADYPMEAAIRDAIYFDGLCSTIVGLEQAAESINHEKNPGLTQSAKVIASVRAMHEISNAPDFSKLQSSGELDKLLNHVSQASIPLAATNSTTETTSSGISETFFSLKPTILAYMDKQASNISASYKQKYDALLNKDKVTDKVKASKKTPGNIQDAFQSAIKKELIDKLDIDSCGNDIPALLTALTTARINLHKADSDGVRVKETVNVGIATSNIAAKDKKLKAIIELAQIDIDTAVKESTTAWASAETFDALIDIDDSAWLHVTPTASDLSGACH